MCVAVYCSTWQHAYPASGVTTAGMGTASCTVTLHGSAFDVCASGSSHATVSADESKAEAAATYVRTYCKISGTEGVMYETVHDFV